VLFQGAQRFPVNTLIEMVFEMPEEISGQKNSSVLCDARVIRANQTGEKASNDGSRACSAAAILGYKFIHAS